MLDIFGKINLHQVPVLYYENMGGSLELWDTEMANRKNPPATAQIFQAHLLGGIQWALGVQGKEKK